MSTIDRMKSIEGIDIPITRQDFRLALQLGCGICVPFYEIVKNFTYDSRTERFWVLEDETSCDDDEILLRNFYVEAKSDVESYDIETIQISALGAHERDNISVYYDVYAQSGTCLFNVSLARYLPSSNLKHKKIQPRVLSLLDLLSDACCQREP